MVIRGPGRPNVPAADGLRGLAALGVVCYHVIYAAGRPRLGSDLIRNLFVSGYMGVDFFFVLSGFLLFLPVANRGEFGSTKNYALRRTVRILPAYYLAVIFTQVFDARLVKVPLDYPLGTHRGLESLLLHLSFLQHNLGPALGFSEGFGVNGVVWTLSIEVLFYLVLPFVAVRYFRRPFLGLGLALGLAGVWRALAARLWLPLPHWPGLAVPSLTRSILITQFPTYLAHFAAGMTAAWIFVRFRRDHINVPAWFAVAAQALGLAGVIWGMAAAGHRDIAGTTGALEHWSSTTPVALSFSLLLLATALAPPWAQWPATNPAVRRLGDISYGVYLWHLLFIGFALQSLHWTPAGTTAAFVRMFGFAFTGAVVAGSLSYYLMERPLIHWARRRSQLRDRRPRPALPAQAGGGVHDDAAESTSTSPARRRSFPQGLGQDDANQGDRRPARSDLR